MYWPFVQVSFKLLRMLIRGFGLYGALTDVFSLLQLTNFSLIPIRWRTAYTGLCGFLWATFLCFSQQEGDGTFKSAFTFRRIKGTNEVEKPPEK